MFPPRLGFLLCLLFSVTALAQEDFRLTVTVEGVEGELRRNVLAYMSLYRERHHPYLNRTMARRLFSEAEGEIRAALQPLGYYRPQVENELDTRDPEHWQARFRIDPGPPLPVARLDLRLTGEGTADPALRQILGRLPLKPGDRFDHRRYEALKQRLLEAALEQGYQDARWRERRAVVDLGAYQARVTLVLDTGPRYRLGPVRFRQDILDPDFLRTFVPFRPGEPYRTDALLRLQRALSDSGYFARVEVRPLTREAEDRIVPVEADLTPLPPDHYGLGLGYGTDTGARARLTWDRRYLNRRGHRLESELYVAETGDRQSISYLIPLDYFQASQVLVNAHRQSESVQGRLRETHALRLAYSQGREGWQRTYALDYQFELYRTDAELVSGYLLMPNLALTHTRSDDRTYPRHGHRIDLDLRGATERLLSSTDFFQATLGLRLIRPSLRRDRWLLRLRGGQTLVRDLDRLPLSLRYYTGGDRTLRGYAFQSVGPDGGGGGSRLLEASIEYERHLRRRWSLGAFFDAANASADGLAPLLRGTGLGLRWRSPVGPVRLDFARALDRPGRPWRVHFNIGPDL